MIYPWEAGNLYYLWAVVVTDILLFAISKCGPQPAVAVNQYEMAANLQGLALTERIPWGLDQTSKVISSGMWFVGYWIHKQLDFPFDSSEPVPFRQIWPITNPQLELDKCSISIYSVLDESHEWCYTPSWDCVLIRNTLDVASHWSLFQWNLKEVGQVRKIIMYILNAVTVEKSRENTSSALR